MIESKRLEISSVINTELQKRTTKGIDAVGATCHKQKETPKINKQQSTVVRMQTIIYHFNVRVSVRACACGCVFACL